MSQFKERYDQFRTSWRLSFQQERRLASSWRRCMNRLRLGLSATLLLFPFFTTISCGTGSSPGRTLVSISVSPAVATPQNPGLAVQFVATGIFSEPPITVTPLPARWKGNWKALPNFCNVQACAGINPNTGLALCGGVPPKATITASAPSDPTLPLGSQNVTMVSGTATLNCP